MGRIGRLVFLNRQFLNNRMGRTTEELMRLARCSRATLKRDLVLLRDGLGAPLTNDGQRPCTWRYEPLEAAGFQLPGVWLGPDDLFALLLLQQLFERSGASFLGEALARLWPKLNRWLGNKVQHLGRIKIIRSRARSADPAVFRVVAESVFERRQLRFNYTGRNSGNLSVRTVSPQRLIHQGDNWYLDAWDPEQTDLRRFAIDRIEQPTVLTEPAFDLDPAQLSARQDRGYGVFAGSIPSIATIRFSAHAARWVSCENWHPDQQQRFLPDGRLEMELPYAHPRELIMDLQRYGADAEVLGPAPLRRQIRDSLRAAAAVYAGDGE